MKHEENMQIFKTSETIGLKNTVVTLGKFDGMHLGHQSLLRQMVMEKENHHLSSVVFSFDIISTMGSGSLTTQQERAYLAEKFGADYLVLFPANKETMQMQPEEFIKTVLIESLGAKIIITGADFRFGKNRTGSVETLQQYAAQYGYSVVVKEDCVYENERISSSRIKQELQTGDLKKAEAMFGYPYFMIGKIIKGKQLGRTMGIRTLNMEVDAKKIMVSKGVYASVTEIAGQSYLSITNIGTCPTVSDEGMVSVETHVFDFDREIYDEKVLVRFLDFVREEQKFSNISELQKQIKKDIEFVKTHYIKYMK